MKFGLDVATSGDFANPRKLVDLAVQAEKSGWDGFFVWDVLFTDQSMEDAVIDPWITLAAIAMNTERIRIGAFMTPLARRRPWLVARQTATLDRLSNGRLVFGAALGYQELDFMSFGEDYDPKVRAQKLDEGLEILTGLWTGDMFSFHGDYYQIDHAKFLPKPIQSPRIPVWTAGGWPRHTPLERAAKWDGIYLMASNQITHERLTPQEIREVVAYIQARRTGKAAFEIAVNVEGPADAKAAVDVAQSYQEAGATWWMELSADTVEEYRKRIQKGPPRV